jgi:hypothetical protein
MPSVDDLLRRVEIVNVEAPPRARDARADLAQWARDRKADAERSLKPPEPPKAA